MLSVEEALEKILGEISVLDAGPVPILEARGQVLTEDIYSSIDVPPLDNSAMDGFAFALRIPSAPAGTLPGFYGLSIL